MMHFANKSLILAATGLLTPHIHHIPVFCPIATEFPSTLSPKELVPKTQLGAARQFDNFGKSMDKCSYYNSSEH